MNLWQKIWKRSFLLGLLPLILLFCGWQGWAWWSWAIAPIQPLLAGATADNSVKGLQIQIPPGTGSQQIGGYLEKAGLIRSQLAWNLWARYLGWKDPEGNFKAGRYQLSPTQPLPGIAQKNLAGRSGAK